MLGDGAYNEPAMKELEPISVIDVVPEERAALLTLLSELSDWEWQQPTVCAGWSVKDVALHLLGDDIGVLSRKRDAFRPGSPHIDNWEELLSFLNEWNDLWVQATRRISPQLLVTLLATTGEETEQHFRSLDGFALGAPVSWAGPDPAPVWLDTAREYTERWLHQQHMRDALRRPGLSDRRFLQPVLDTFVRALPHTYRDAEAPRGSRVMLTITGDAGGAWTLVREAERWALFGDEAPDAASQVIMDQETAWRLFTKGITKEEALRTTTVRGDLPLGMPVLDTVSIIA